MVNSLFGGVRLYARDSTWPWSAEIVLWLAEMFRGLLIVNVDAVELWNLTVVILIDCQKWMI